jgi:hypothetical protein
VTDDQSDPELEALVAASLVKRGELIPTTVEEVLETDASFDGALPESLHRLHRPGRARPPPRSRCSRCASPRRR